VVLACETEAGEAPGPLESDPPQEMRDAEQTATIDGTTKLRTLLTRLEGIWGQLK
jgi:hypothetical protein